MDASPFAKLSPELRNLIYEYTLTRDGAYSLSGRYSSKVRRREKDFCDITQDRRLASPPLLAVPKQIRNPYKVAQPLALSQTCKAIHAESTRLFYSLNTFKIEIDPDIKDLARISEWINQLGSVNTGALRNVLIDTWEPWLNPVPDSGLLPSPPSPHDISHLPAFVHALRDLASKLPTCSFEHCPHIAQATRRWVHFRDFKLDFDHLAESSQKALDDTLGDRRWARIRPVIEQIKQMEER